MLSNISQVYLWIIHGIYVWYPIYPRFIPWLYMGYTYVIQYIWKFIHGLSQDYTPDIPMYLGYTMYLWYQMYMWQASGVACETQQTCLLPLTSNPKMKTTRQQRTLAAKDSAIADFLKRLEGLEKHQYTGWIVSCTWCLRAREHIIPRSQFQCGVWDRYSIPDLWGY